MGDQQVLHLFRSDLLAAAVDLVLVAALHHQVAVLVAADPVAGAVEAVRAEGLGVVFGQAVVAADGVGTAHGQFADLAGADLAALGVDHPHFVVRRQRPALGMQYALGRIVQAGVADQPLGHSQHLLQLAAEHRFDALRGTAAEPGTADLEQTQAG